MIKIFDFNENYIEEVQKIAVANYNEERNIVTVLPNVMAIPDLEWFANNKKGVVAYENDKMVGYLCT